MNLKIKRINRVDLVAEERLYLNAARNKILREGEKGALYLLASEGSIISPYWVKALGLDKSPKTEESPETEEKKTLGLDESPKTEEKKTRVESPKIR